MEWEGGWGWLTARLLLAGAELVVPLEDIPGSVRQDVSCKSNENKKKTTEEATPTCSAARIEKRLAVPIFRVPMA